MAPRLTLLLFQYGETAPLNAAYLCHGLKKAKINFSLELCRTDNFRKMPKRLFSLLKKSGEIVAVGCSSDAFPYVIAALADLKKLHPEKTIILGGPAPSMVAGEILKNFGFVDYVVRGCGILPLPELALAIAGERIEINNIRGLVFRRNGRIVSNPPYEAGENIPPIPQYGSIKNVRDYKEFSVLTSFGCPYSCTFCYASPVCGSRVRNRPLRDVMREIRAIKKIKKGGKFSLALIDEAFILNKKRALEFCAMINKSGPRIPWNCFGRVDRMDEELLQALKRAGCVSVYYGIESGSNPVLKKIKKGFTIESAVRVAVLTKKYIPCVVASFIYRYPFETEKDFLETHFHMMYLRSKAVKVQLHPLAPVKNSEIYLKYGKDIRFSKNEVCDYFFGRCADVLPSRYLKLIKDNPSAFYDYRYYRSAELGRINSILKLYNLGRFRR